MIRVVSPNCCSAVCIAEQQLGDTGRILLRASGTEPLIRVMVEGRDADLVQKQADLLADAVREATLSHSAQSA